MRISDWSSDVCSSDLWRSGVRGTHLRALFTFGLDGRVLDLKGLREHLCHAVPCRLRLRDVIDHDVNRAADIAACDRPDVKIMGTLHARDRADRPAHLIQGHATRHALQQDVRRIAQQNPGPREHPKADADRRSEEHTSELQSLMRTSYAVFCL